MKPTQLDLDLRLAKDPDRNSKHGGRSFYFFDIDDNVLHLSTPIYIFHRQTGEELALGTAKFAQIQHLLGKPGEYEDFRVDTDDLNGSFRRFRDNKKKRGRPQFFVEDVAAALARPDYLWKGPSWDCFYYAVYNARPVSLITARGHHPDTIKQGISLLVKEGFLPAEPNYLDVFPVSNSAVRRGLGDRGKRLSTAVLKKKAIIKCVGSAMKKYGPSSMHRFGMSDDDPANIALIIEAVRILKKRHPLNSFYVIHTDRTPFTKEEILAGEEDLPREDICPDQLELF